MNLKTSQNMHIHGADGVYLGATNGGKPALYWGESKIHRNLSRAVKECFDSLSKFLNSEGGLFAEDNRDFILLNQFIDLNDNKLESSLRNYLDRDSPHFNSVEIRAIAFVGFQNEYCYPKEPNTQTIEDVEKIIVKKIPRLKKVIKKATMTNSLENFVIHFFCIPFKSVKVLRDEFYKYLSLSEV